MKVAIIGSRSLSDYSLVDEALRTGTDLNTITAIISGGAKGADTLAEKFAADCSLEIQIFKPDWKLYGRGAGIVRNKQIIESADKIFAFWDGKSKGTLNSINIAKKLGKDLTIIEY
ncbi:SLOG family protein [Marinomonas algarum]|uniref:DUF2493 domain-containing protein n=1 Tax=Marinomonas algarum TaxID=2883105 RepID=A0A9X1IQZ9_9GAMM|nr:SLOG family protein [Marinomonas algarum]MCB5162631.1 DUF2493 domain-containing protein [Marinomonas algarum]